jgi:hypothetical protein
MITSSQPTATPSPHPEYAVNDDLVRWGHLLEHNWYLNTESGVPYYLTHDSDGSLTLWQCFSASPDQSEDSPRASDSHPFDFVTSIVELSGEVECNRLRPIPAGNSVSVTGRTAVGTEDRLLVVEDGSNQPSASLFEEFDETALWTFFTNHREALTQAGSLYERPTTGTDEQASRDTGNTRANQRLRGEATDLRARYIDCQMYSRWTFDDDVIRKWTEERLRGRVLNPTAGKNSLSHDGEVLRNDINPERPADTHVDAAELCREYPPNHFSTIVFDPPWSVYQSNLRYDGEHVMKSEMDSKIDLSSLPIYRDLPTNEEKSQLGHARLCKESFRYLLKPGGTYLEFGFHGTGLPARMDAERVERVVFDPIGEAKATIVSHDRLPGGDTGAEQQFHKQTGLGQFES